LDSDVLDRTCGSGLALEGRGLTVSYGRRRVIDGLDVALGQGGVTALCGPNGCGKSTLLRSLAGLQPLAAGEVLVEGRPMARLSRRERARALTMLAQANETPAGLTVRELVTFGRHAHRRLLGGLSVKDRSAVDDALEALGLADLGDRELVALSGGEQQRAWIAMALAQECRTLLLDEPTTWLDVRHQVELIGALRRLNRERGVTIVCVLHDLNQAAAVADRVILMRDGTIRHDGPPDEALTPERLDDVFGVAMRRVEARDGAALGCLPVYAETFDARAAQ